MGIAGRPATTQDCIAEARIKARLRSGVSLDDCRRSTDEEQAEELLDGTIRSCSAFAHSCGIDVRHSTSSDMDSGLRVHAVVFIPIVFSGIRVSSVRVRSFFCWRFAWHWCLSFIFFITCFIALDAARTLHGDSRSPVYHAIISMLRYLCYFYSCVSVALDSANLCDCCVTHAVNDNGKPGICEYGLHEVM